MVAQGDDRLDVPQQSRDTGFDLFIRHIMTAFFDTLRNPGFIETGRFQVNHYQDYLISQGFCLTREINLARVRKDSFKTETSPVMEQVVTDLLDNLHRLVTVNLRRLGKQLFRYQVGIHKRDPERGQASTIKSTLAGAIAARQQPELFSLHFSISLFRQRREYSVMKLTDDHPAIRQYLLKLTGMKA